MSKLRVIPWPEVVAGSPVDYHNHTSYTDGTATIGEMAAAATKSGMSEMLFSEHIRHTSTYFPEFAREVRAIQLPGLQVHLGLEAKILDLDGQLDCPPSAEAVCDAMIGSVHSLPPSARGAAQRWSELDAAAAVEIEFRYALAIVEKSRAKILGHPMGMCVSRFRIEPLEQLAGLAAACCKHGKAFELNTRYCSTASRWVEIVAAAGCPVSIGSDAHRSQDVGRAWNVFRGLRP